MKDGPDSGKRATNGPGKRERAVAVVGVGAILPDAPDAAAFWRNLRESRYSITEVSPSRWDPDLYFDPDPKTPDTTYSKIGGWVRDWAWDPFGWKLAVPPTVSDNMDDGQKWAIACTREALLDYGYPARPLDQERTAVILGNAMAGERHYETSMRIYFPEFAEQLRKAPSFVALPPEIQAAMLEEFHAGVGGRFPRITEDTMPGELGNILAGRVANLFNFRGPNFVTDAACASAMAAMNAAFDGLIQGDFDAVVAGGIDRNMGASAFVKFCKIGALSATGTRPYDEGADGFVMGEGAAVFLLKRLTDAEAAGDRIYAVIRALAGSSDGKGKGITAPNPAGQKLAIERAWRRAGVLPDVATLIEGHGTSTRVGDVAEVESLHTAFAALGVDVPIGSIPLGSVKSNIGHLKAAAGAAGVLKAVLALHHRELPPSLGFDRPNPGIDFERSPLAVNTELRAWEIPNGSTRRAGVSAFGFGGTNFHAVLEEYVPGVSERAHGAVRTSVPEAHRERPAAKAPLRGALVVGAQDTAGLIERLGAVRDQAEQGIAPPDGPPLQRDLDAPVRVAIDHADAADLAAKATQAVTALRAQNPAVWKALKARGIFTGSGPAPKVAFLYTGQGSQYANMLAGLRASEPLVARAFAEADGIMSPLLGRPLTSYLFVDPGDTVAVSAAEADLMRTEITQPAVLSVDLALTDLLAAYGIHPDMVMGHSLGEYGALVAAGSLTFGHALEAVSARGREMASIEVEDNGKMAAVFAPLEEIERIVAGVDGYVVIANINSRGQGVIGGASGAVDQAVEAFGEAGFQAIPLPVSHAFHTSIVAAASEPLRRTLIRLELRPPRIPIVANVSGEFYPIGPDVVPEMLDGLARQVASPVQFVKGLETLYEAGARVFVEVGPKKALQGFVDDVLGDRDGVRSLFTNHPKVGDLVAFNQALCGLYAAGLGTGVSGAGGEEIQVEFTEEDEGDEGEVLLEAAAEAASEIEHGANGHSTGLGAGIDDLIERPKEMPHAAGPGPNGDDDPDRRPVVITGAGIGLPGTERIFDEANVGRILRGGQFIDVIPTRLRQAMLDKHITRLVKRENGDPTFERIESQDEVIKLAARGGAFDLSEEFGVDPDRVLALDRSTQLAMAAGIDALRDAGLPLVMRYHVTTKGTKLPERWALPEELRDDTGVIFASAFPGYDSMVDEVTRYHRDRSRRELIEALESARSRLVEGNGQATLVVRELDRRIQEVRDEVEQHPYVFDRRFLFHALSMGHAQFAELIGARGPNMQINSACASTTQAIALAGDWIRAERCRRVIVIAADDATSDTMMEWIGAGFLASGAAATDDVVEDAATPFDRRRHGMIIGMGAAAIVVERSDAARERGIRPIAEVLGAVTANSAFHGSRLDVYHITQVMERLVAGAEARWGISRQEIAPQLVFVSHETYTPARGGSAAAEVEALRAVFGSGTDSIVVANTKGFTGHPMGVGIEDVVALKSLETGLVPPVPNFKEVDPDLGMLNLSKGGLYPIRYALRLAAGFGSQISMTLMRVASGSPEVRPTPGELGFDSRLVDRAAWASWLTRVSGEQDPQVEVLQHRLVVTESHARAAAPAPVLLEPTVVLQTRVEPVAEPIMVPEVAEPEVIEPEVGLDEATVRDALLALVAAKTGYPADMLELDLDLEADLGVDTVKQAEIFASIRETYSIPRDDTLKLRDFPTLQHVIGFVMDRTSQPEIPAASEPAAEPLIADAEAAGSSTTVDEAAVRDALLALVAEKTGYPADMLELDLDLEADLGVDTVKQAEIFASIRETYAIPRDDTLKLRDFPTLQHVIGFVMDRAPKAEPSVEPQAEVIEPEPMLVQDFGAAGQVPARIPVPVLRPPLDMTSETGVQLGAHSRILVMADETGVAKDLARELENTGATVLLVDDRPEAAALEARLHSWLETSDIQGVFWLPGLDRQPPLDQLDLPSWRELLRVRVKLLYRTMRALGEVVGPRGSFLVSATRLGGLHGYDAAGALAPMGGAVTGFTKAFARERPDALVKAIDFGPDAPAVEIVAALVDEARRDPAVVEVGHRDGLRWTIGLEIRPDAPATSAMPLGKDSVFVVTGAAGSIVSAIVSDLARASGGTFHLLDLVPAPDPDDPDIRAFDMDRDALKRELFERLKARGDRPTPALIERELAGIERRSAARGALRAIEEAGGRAHYHQVNLLETGGVGAVMDMVRAQSGRIDVLLHAAGIEISHLIADKEPGEFDLVFDVKADGWFNLLHAAGDLPIGATVAFSSVAGRFGNAGQTDYSSANDLLCKATSNLRRTRPDTRGIAIDWTAWAGIGMASRGSIPKMMELAGIDMLPPEAGIPVIRRELSTGFKGEVVIGDRLGTLVEETDSTGPLYLPVGDGLTWTVTSAGRFLPFEAETVLDPKQLPFLDHHRIDGTPVLPGVMGIEAFAEASRLLLPGWSVASVEDVEFLVPFKFYRDEPRPVTVRVAWRPDGDEVLAACSLIGTRELPGQAEPQVTTHFAASVRLSRVAPQAGIVELPAMTGHGIAAEDIYRIYFHGPAYRVLGRAVVGPVQAAGFFAEELPTDAPGMFALWPRLIELCFQTAGVWDLHANGRMALPWQVGRVIVTPAGGTPEGLVALVMSRAGGFDAKVVDGSGKVWVELTDYRTVELPGQVDPFLLAAIGVAPRTP